MSLNIGNDYDGVDRLQVSHVEFLRFGLPGLIPHVGYVGNPSRMGSDSSSLHKHDLISVVEYCSFSLLRAWTGGAPQGRTWVWNLGVSLSCG